MKLESPISDSFRCVRAANSLDIDVKKKAVHELQIEADMDRDFNVGLIVGSSGSGKTTLARQIFGPHCFEAVLDSSKPVIDQLPDHLSYDDCAELLTGIGLTSVPCWIRPAGTLSNGQRARAEAALLMARARDAVVAVDEWTSVVDRVVAKVMSHCVQKFARKHAKRIVLLSCHYDVVDWLNPDWIIDCNTQRFNDRRSLRPEDRCRREELRFDVREVGRETWKFFSRYYYLSANLPAGNNHFYGLFSADNQIGFGMYSNYVPRRPGTRIIYHSNRVVVHPDYAGLGLGLKFVNATAALMKQKQDCEVYATFSSTPMYRARVRDRRHWKLIRVERRIGAYKKGGAINRNKKGIQNGGYRRDVKLFTFKYVGAEPQPSR